MGEVELQYRCNQPLYPAASGPFLLQVSAMQELTTGPRGGAQSEAGEVTWFCEKQSVQQLGIV